jgi:hypothetical protein
MRRDVYQRAVALLIIGMTAGCGSSDSSSVAPTVDAASTLTAADVASEPAPPVALPSPRYDQEENGTYYYVAAVSEEDRKRGKVAGDVIGFRFLGQNDKGELVLQQIANDGTPASKSYCAKPCRIIRGVSGRVGFTTDSIIGAAFQDAMDGLLKPYGAGDGEGYPKSVSTVPKVFRGSWDELVSDGCKGREARFMIDETKFYNFEVEFDVTGVKLYSPTEADVFTTYKDENGAQEDQVWSFRVTDGGKALTSRKPSTTFYRRCPGS